MAFNKNELQNMLVSLDIYFGKVLEPGSKIALLIIGGASLIISKITSRLFTEDIDVFVADPENWKLLGFESFFTDEIVEEIEDRFEVNSAVYFFKLKDIIPALNMKYVRFQNEEWNKKLIFIEAYTLNIEGLVLTKLLAMMDEDPGREDRDYIDIKDAKDKVDFSILENYIEIWKNKFAKKSQLEKFDKAYNRWINN